MDGLLTVEGSMSDTYCRMHQYSMGNCALFLVQGIPPQPVATYKGWEAVGRHVTKGAKAKWVLRPIDVKLKNREDEDGNPIHVRRFKLVRAIFPLEATNGEPLPKMETPAWSQERALTTLDITEVPFATFDSNTQGYSQGRTFAINPVAKWPKKTLQHELGHIVLGHTDLEFHDYQMHRGVREFQAEGTAHLVMNELDMVNDFDPAESRGYLQGWLRGETPSDEQIRQVFKATDVILKAGRPVAETFSNQAP